MIHGITVGSADVRREEHYKVDISGAPPLTETYGNTEFMPARLDFSYVDSKLQKVIVTGPTILGKGRLGKRWRSHKFYVWRDETGRGNWPLWLDEVIKVVRDEPIR